MGGASHVFRCGGLAFMALCVGYGVHMFGVRQASKAPFRPPTLKGAEVTTTRAPPTILPEAFRKLAEAARAELERGAQPGAAELADKKKHGWVFGSVLISMPLAQPIVVPVRPRGAPPSEGKNVVGMQVLNATGRKCVVYGMGIAGESHFEQTMAESGCETHAFDCTIKPDSPAVKDKAFTFHEWCIGPEKSKINKNNLYLVGGGLRFKTFTSTLKELGHPVLDILKFDIEGFEWTLFEEDLLPASILPNQLSFELHTEGANTAFVPPEPVKGKSFEEVNALILRLFDLGYRVVDKAVNYDQFCSEFTLVRVAD